PGGGFWRAVHRRNVRNSSPRCRPILRRPRREAGLFGFIEAAPRRSRIFTGEDIMKTIIAIASAALVAIAAGHASAQTDALKATVRYADLDLSRASGRAVLEQRIDVAVSKVCGGAPSNFDLDASHAFGQCREQTWSGVRQQLAMIYGGSQLAQAIVTVGPRK